MWQDCHAPSRREVKHDSGHAAAADTPDCLEESDVPTANIVAVATQVSDSEHDSGHAAAADTPDSTGDVGCDGLLGRMPTPAAADITEATEPILDNACHGESPADETARLRAMLSMR